jgi:alternative ribosome-rescue factor
MRHISRLFPAQDHHTERTLMSKKPAKHGPNKAKSIVAQPLFRSRQERPAKGKGSYRREAFRSDNREAFYFLAA